MFGNEGLSRRTMMKFMVVQASSPYNIILGRTGIRELRAISSTTHAMIKFLTPRGIATLKGNGGKGKLNRGRHGQPDIFGSKNYHQNTFLPSLSSPIGKVVKRQQGRVPLAAVGHGWHPEMNKSTFFKREYKCYSSSTKTRGPEPEEDQGRDEGSRRMGYSSKNYVRKFLRALRPKWRAKVMAIEESKDLMSLSLDELIGNLKVHEMIIKKDYKIVKAKVERKYIALKAKKESSDEECLTFNSEDEEYAVAVRDFKKFFKKRGRFVRQPQNDKKIFQRSRDDKNGKGDRICFRCGDRNNLIGECPKPPKDKNQRAFVGGSWSDSGEEDDEKVKDKMCLVAHTSSEVCSESSYFSDENSSIDDIALNNEYDKLCKMSLKITTKNKRLKASRNKLENDLRELKDKLSKLEKNKGVDLDCAKCHVLKIENEKLKDESEEYVILRTHKRLESKKMGRNAKKE
nr:zf-CCHC domain-containing protein/UBN2 domain-containing protein [Tanacetum cinerariifolium]